MRRVAAVIAFSAALAGCSLAGDVTPPAGWTPAPQVSPQEISVDWPSRPPDPRAGAEIYRDRCAACHGETGKGDGPQAGSLPVSPAPLGDPAVSRAAIPVDWYRIVTAGNLDRFMPPFASLSVEERWDVVTYALSLGLDPGMEEQGTTIYENLCTGCHGPAAEVKDLPDLETTMARSLDSLAESIGRGVLPGMPAFEARLDGDQLEAAAFQVRELALLALPSPAGSDAAPKHQIAIAGQVTSGSTGALVPEDLVVTLHAFDHGQAVWEETRPVDRQARFSLDEAAVDAGWVMVASVEHEGVVYLSEAKALVGDEMAIELPITIYETTESAESVQIEQLHFLLDFPAPGILRVVEVMGLANSGDRTVVPGSDGVTLTVPLPENIFHLQWEDPNASVSFRQTEGGFDLLLPIRPGPAAGTFVFQFELPYNRSLALRQKMAGPTAGGLVLVPVGGPQVSGIGVEAEGVRDVQGTRVEVYALPPSAGGSSIALEVSGRPPGEGPDADLFVGAAAVLGSLALSRRWLIVAGKGPR